MHICVNAAWCVAYKADINLRDSMGRHALHLSAESGSVAAVQFIVTDAGVNVNLQTVVTCDTALHFAAKVWYAKAHLLSCHKLYMLILHQR